MSDIDENALTAAHVAVEDVLIDFRDRRLSVLNRANGFVVREMDGTESSIMRLGTRDGLRIGIAAYLKALADPASAQDGLDAHAAKYYGHPSGAPGEEQR